MKGKWALVTGATSGLGYAVAEGLAGAGANIVLHDLAAPKQAADDLRARFRVEVIAAGVDLSRRKAIEAGMADLLKRCGGIDILVNNAVVRHFAAIEQFPPERWDEALAVNLSAPFHLIRLALPAMRQRGWGRIINMGSIYSSRAVEDRIDYVTTKTAIAGMTRAVAIETARSGITCNMLCPGTLPTPAIVNKIAGMAETSGRPVAEVTRDYLGERQPTHRFIDMGAVAAMVVFLCGPAANDITGASLPIDGGWSVA
ncbi:3-hydroxybutyrate dehydrogenase [Bradyrhizobium sp. R2.2-H]|jgi:3-hydroxybutyrate dehydrogenase|uniref:SDR family oxidoreductase n=1 Tax=unclassified Bradyrhizobium TaxID=2631580 RepID=UPI00104DA8B4|nr:MULTISPECIES: SDR family oxidoreductase [unclassified Bradyrhizobium]TCU69312.1 3-hydroxybutyrate dehydrogenase [Bradyrhizobium sp. Y-H1]TCU70804.1 3-hydroxybutyrate dehydrogenase [Bradyrhizobium sp. R2.2-H]